MNKQKSLKTVLIILGLLALSACQNHEGPAERAGKEIDNATVKAGQQIEKAGESIQGAAKGDKR